jgi:hypothetical protein
MKLTRQQLREVIIEQTMTEMRHAEWESESSTMPAGGRVDPVGSAEERADTAMVDLLNAYLEQYLDLSGSNRMDALDQAYADLRNFTEDLITVTKDFEEDPQKHP